MPYRERNKPARSPKPQPKPRKRGPLTPAKPCVIESDSGTRISYKGKDYFDLSGKPPFTIFPSRVKAKAALWHILEKLKGFGEFGPGEYYTVVRYDESA